MTHPGCQLLDCPCTQLMQSLNARTGCVPEARLSGPGDFAVPQRAKPLQSEKGTTQKVLQIVASKRWLKTRPESGLDCLICAEFARQRICPPQELTRWLRRWTRLRMRTPPGWCNPYRAVTLPDIGVPITSEFPDQSPNHRWRGVECRCHFTRGGGINPEQ